MFKQFNDDPLVEEPVEGQIFGGADTPNATTFHPKDAPEGYRLGEKKDRYRDWYERLRGHNLGHNGWWYDNKKINELGKLAVARMIISQLELRPYQRSEVERLLTTVCSDLRRYNASNTNTTETAIIAMCAFVCRADGRRSHPNHKEFDYLIECLKDECEVREDHYKRTYARIEYDVRISKK